MSDEAPLVDFDDPPSTAARICSTMSEIGDIPKDGWNSAQSYAFRRIEDVTVRVRDVMGRNGLVCIPVASEVVSATPYETEKGKRATSVVIRQTYAFISTDDPSDRIEIQTIGEGADTQDKATTKALTAAYKYALLQSFAIGEGGDDGDARSGADDEPASDAATDEELTRIRAAVDLLPPEEKPLINAYWQLAKVGSISEKKIDRRAIPGFFALIDALASVRSSE
jgi:hypothetical protein